MKQLVGNYREFLLSQARANQEAESTRDGASLDYGQSLSLLLKSLSRGKESQKPFFLSLSLCSVCMICFILKATKLQESLVLNSFKMKADGGFFS